MTNFEDSGNHYQQALYDFCESNYGSALTNIRKALEEEPKNPKVLYLLAKILWEFHELDEALKHSQAAIDLDTNCHYLELKGCILTKKGKCDEAIEVFDQAIELNPNNSSFKINKAIALLRLKSLEYALPILNEVIKDNNLNLTTEFIAYHTRNLVLMELGKIEEAKADLRKIYPFLNI